MGKKLTRLLSQTNPASHQEGCTNPVVIEIAASKTERRKAAYEFTEVLALFHKTESH